MASEREQLADPSLLDKIDQLFALNLGEQVSLPQLIVVGDQSSGKSSVLEGLTGLAFPRDSGLCTRFATQITFRRHYSAEIAVSLIPAADAARDHAEKLRAWKKEQFETLDKDAFETILHEVINVPSGLFPFIALEAAKVSQVYVLMGLDNQPSETDSKKTFSNDVLKIEIQGPTQDHLSVIDVPGIFKKTTAGVTTKDDIGLVRNMVLTYMRNQRSVILAVIPANVDIATQEILEIAEECDRDGQRTLGVLTKPDLVDGGAERAVLDIVEGKKHPLNLGWCIVKNPGQQYLSMSAAARMDAEKTFFRAKDPWVHLPKDRVGTEALRQRLVEILSGMVQREFSSVKRDIISSLREKKKQLHALGASRESRDQQYDYLLDLATNFQGIVAQALNAQYGSTTLFDDFRSLRIATQVVNRNEAFAKDMADLGHTIKYWDYDQSDSAEADFPHEEEEELPETKSQSSVAGSDAPAERKKQSTRKCIGFEHELEDVLAIDEEVDLPSRANILAWLKTIYTGARGFELGSFDNNILPTVWKKQTVKWNSLAEGYTSDIVVLIHTFIVELLSALCENTRVQNGILSALLDTLFLRYKKAMATTQFLLDVERQGLPQTANDYFHQNLEASRQGRIKRDLEKSAVYKARDEKWVRIDDHVRITKHGNLEHSMIDFHDILHSYSKVARKRFVDNVSMQSVGYYLVNGPESPLKVFSPSFVGKLSGEQLKNIAGEEPNVLRKRGQLNKEIEELEKGKKVLV